MPATSTAFNACGATIRLANNLGTLIDISGSSNSVDVDLKSELGDFKLFGDVYVYRLECAKDGDVKLSVVYTSAAGEGADLLKRWRLQRGPRLLELVLPNGDIYSGNVVMENLKLQAKADEAKPIMMEASLKSHGAFDVVFV